MQWGSVENFLSMGGYGFYVWGSYLVCAAVIVAEVVLARVKKKLKDSRHELFPRSLDRISSRRGELFVVRLII
jgi:heme exporter protein D